MLPELGGDLDDELFGNSDSGNQPSTSNPTSVQAQTDGTQEVQRDLNNQNLSSKLDWNAKWDRLASISSLG